MAVQKELGDKPFPHESGTTANEDLHDSYFHFSRLTDGRFNFSLAHVNMKHIRSWALVFNLWLAFVAFGAENSELVTVPDVDLKKYVGKWYEIASFPGPHQDECAATQATYTLREDGELTVLNECRDKNLEGEWRKAEGKAWLPDAASPGKLKVRFMWPFSAHYWIIELGPNYEYSVISEPKRKFLWILSRTRQMPKITYDAITERLKARGFDLTNLRKTLQPSDLKGYPAIWFTAVNDKKAPSWEILPQAAKPGEVILSKRNDLGVLSNFAATPFTFHGLRYASLEGLWQAMLYPEDSNDERAKAKGVKWKYTRDQVAAMTAFEAKAAGDLAFANMKKLKINWVTLDGKRMDYWTPDKGEHYQLIKEATWEKVKQNPKVKETLLATAGLKLLPDHHQEPNAPPAWRYFEILTEIREDLLRTTSTKP